MMIRDRVSMLCHLALSSRAVAWRMRTHWRHRLLLTDFALRPTLLEFPAARRGRYVHAQ